MRNLINLILSILLFISCSTDEENLFDPNAVRNPPTINKTTFADPNLNQQARDLYTRLQLLTQKGVAFGQQVPFGTGNNFPMPNKLDNDFKEVANDYPAVAGFDIELIGSQILFEPFLEKFTKAIVKAHENGSIITISWHAINPSDFRGNKKIDNVIPEMLENGEFRSTFLMFLERAATLFKNLKDADGNPIPVLFRPWHEMNGDFFYWGEGLRTSEEYKQLYKDTVKILSEDFNVHNVRLSKNIFTLPINFVSYIYEIYRRKQQKSVLPFPFIYRICY